MYINAKSWGVSTANLNIPYFHPPQSLNCYIARITIIHHIQQTKVYTYEASQSYYLNPFPISRRFQLRLVLKSGLPLSCSHIPSSKLLPNPSTPSGSISSLKVTSTLLVIPMFSIPAPPIPRPFWPVERPRNCLWSWLAKIFVGF